jgi:hypothetical protein
VSGGEEADLIIAADLNGRILCEQRSRSNHQKAQKNNQPMLATQQVTPPKLRTVSTVYDLQCSRRYKTCAKAITVISVKTSTA